MEGNLVALREANAKALETAMELGLETEEGRKAYELAMSGIDREAKLSDGDIRKKESKNNLILRCIEVGGGILLAPLIETACKKVYAELICNFEKDYSFTTSAGRSLNSLFRFKK